MKRDQIFNIILAVVLALLLLICILTVLAVFRLGMIPAKFCYMLAGVFAFLVALTGLLMFLRLRKKAVSLLRRIIACVLAVLIAAGCVFICSVTNKVYNTVQNITTPPSLESVRTVYVLSDSSAQTLADLADVTFGVMGGYEEASSQEAIGVIEEQLGKQITVLWYDSVTDVVDNLYNGQIEAMILNSAYLGVLKDMDGYDDIYALTRPLYDAPVTLPSDPTDPSDPDDPTDSTDVSDPSESTEPSEGGWNPGLMDPSKPSEMKDITQRVFAIYVSGSDSKSEMLSSSTRSDVNIVVLVNPMTKQILLLNTPRDYYVANPNGYGAMDKLTHCGLFGVNCSVRTLELLYNVRIDYYVRINFAGFKSLIDAIGGINVYSSYEFTTVEGVSVVKGYNYFNGAEALAFARERKQLPSGDHSRGRNQMRIIEAIISKLSSGSVLLTNYSSILDSLNGMLTTNMSADNINKLVKMQLNDMAQWTVLSYAVEGNDGYEPIYSWPGQTVYVIYPNKKHVEQATSLMRRMFNGEVLTKDDLKRW